MNLQEVKLKRKNMVVEARKSSKLYSILFRVKVCSLILGVTGLLLTAVLDFYVSKDYFNNAIFIASMPFILIALGLEYFGSPVNRKLSEKADKEWKDTILSPYLDEKRIDNIHIKDIKYSKKQIGFQRIIQTENTESFPKSLVHVSFINEDGFLEEFVDYVPVQEDPSIEYPVLSYARLAEDVHDDFKKGMYDAMVCIPKNYQIKAV